MYRNVWLLIIKSCIVLIFFRVSLWRKIKLQIQYLCVSYSTGCQMKWVLLFFSSMVDLSPEGSLLNLQEWFNVPREWKWWWWWWVGVSAGTEVKGVGVLGLGGPGFGVRSRTSNPIPPAGCQPLPHLTPLHTQSFQQGAETQYPVQNQWFVWML